MSEEPETLLELQSAADALGVHYQTAYRWVRNGRLPAQLTGGKYLVSSADIAEVGASRHLPQAPAVPSAARLDRQSERMHEALLTGDESEARKIARRLVDEGATIVELIEQVISPPLLAIGQAWHDGNLTVWVEHRASAIIERALGDLLPNQRGRRRGTVLGKLFAHLEHGCARSAHTRRKSPAEQDGRHSLRIRHWLMVCARACELMCMELWRDG